MPPRKRARRSGVDEPTPTPPPPPPPPTARTQQRPAAGGSRYRTRHRRDVRGPELAVLEGGRADLVPPSDDEEYDEWRAVRAVERAERERERERLGAPESLYRIEEPVAGPSHSRRRFVFLFSSPGSSRSPSPVASPPESPSDMFASHPPRLSSKGKGRAEASPSPSQSPPSQPPHAERITLQLGSPKLFTCRRSPGRRDHLPSHSYSPPPPASEPVPPVPPHPPPQVSSADADADATLPDVHLDDDLPSGTPVTAVRSPSVHESQPTQPMPDVGLGSFYSHDSQLPLPREMIEEPWGMDLDVEDTSGPAKAGSASQTALQRSTHFLASQVRANLSSPSPSRVDSSRPPPRLSQAILPPSSPVQSPPVSQPTDESQRRATPLPGPLLPPSPFRPSEERPASQQPPPPSSPDALDLLADNRAAQVAAVRPTASQTDNVPGTDHGVDRPPQPSIDPALLQFRIARTFRTRTALQLQPYTKEKQLYENALRKGGLAKGRRAVAPSAEIRAANEEETQTQEGQSSSDSEATPPDAIVIGATQEQAPPRRREPKPLVDADYDEYFLEFGEVADDDEECQKRLQVIARKRLRAAKEARRKERAAERTRRAFENLMKETDREKEVERKEAEKRQRENTARGRELSKGPSKTAPRPAPATREKSPARTSRITADRDRARVTSTNRTPARRGRTVTYSRRTQRQVLDRPDSESPLSSPPPSPSTSQHQSALSPNELPPPLSTPALTSHPGRAWTSTTPPGALPAEPMDIDTLDIAREGDSHRVDDFETAPFGGFVDSDDDRPFTPHRLSSPPAAPTSRSTRRRRIASSSSHSSDTDTGDSSQPQVDKRRRIAERMLPRAMLKRLEQEAAQQKRRKEDRQRRAARADDSPVRPGHAVVRRRGGGALDDIGDLFDDGSESDDGRGLLSLHAEERDESDVSSDEGLGRQLILTLQSDSEGSEAAEDSGRPAALARLQRGDFEAIVHGRRSVEPRQRGPQRGELRRHRPALRISKRPSTSRTGEKNHARVSKGRILSESQLYQTRLNSPVEETTPVRPQKSKARSSKSKSKSSARADRGGKDDRRSKGAARPAIRLDDNVIFATGDFAFSSDSDDIEIQGATPAPAPRALPRGPLAQMTTKNGRLYARTASSPTPAPPPPRRAPAPKQQLDEGVGKARSWANFDRFPIDFEITPLPMGVYCGAETVPGSGLLGTFLGQLDGEFLQELKPISTHGVSLHSEMSSDEALEVLPIVLDGMTASIRSCIDATSTAKVHSDLRPLRFIRDYLAQADVDTRGRLFAPFRNFGQQLDDVVLDSSRARRGLVLQLLEVRYALFEIAAIAGDREDLATAATQLIGLLLVYGFDRTVRPLRRILSGQADTPEVTDVTVALWVSLLHILAAYDKQHPPSTNAVDDTFSAALAEALSRRYGGEIGPLAAERIWFLVFGLCAIAQFGVDGTVVAEYTPYPRWTLVKLALGHIKITHSQEAEESAHLDQLQGRDRYIKTVVARCLRLSSTWRWNFDSRSFSVATRDLGMIFKARQHRNLPTEPPADFPRFIADFDISLTAEDDTRRASAFELWLRLACVAASDLIGAAEELSAAHRAERDVQRLIMSIFPLSAVPFTRASPPTPRQLSALVNRYSTMVVACYFSPSLLPWLLANSRKWLAFDAADFGSRQVCIRGLMYLGVACRHHSHPLDAVVGRLADILATLQAEFEQLGRPTNAPSFPTRIEIERTMVLVVSCFRQIIVHPRYLPSAEPVYPDPVLLHESWTARIFQLDLVRDVKSGLEVVATIQAFLDARATALPKRAKAARTLRQQESVDDYPSLGFDFNAIDLAALGGDEAPPEPEDPIEVQDAVFAETIVKSICPRIYRLLSDMLPASEINKPGEKKGAERLVLINRLTQCWSDCAAVAVVEHNRSGWDVYASSYGAQSWSRIGNDLGRIRVGLQFMTNVAHLDPGSFRTLESEYILLLFQSIATDRLTIEHKFTSALFSLPGTLDHMLFDGIQAVGVEDLSRTTFMERRLAILKVAFRNIPSLLGSHLTPTDMRTLIVRCMNTLVESMVMYDGAIDARGVLHRQAYRVFVGEVVRALRLHVGEHVREMTASGLKALEWA